MHLEVGGPMNKFMVCLLMVVLNSCGNVAQESAFAPEAATTASIKELSANSLGIELIDIDPGLACLNGGISIITFLDTNSDYLYQETESILKSKAICHGLNGTNSSVNLEAFNSSSNCPSGGVKISSSPNPEVEVCNGAQGVQGLQGLVGLQGIQGVAGAAGVAGTQVIPVKFCTTDNSQFPEYGLMIGSDLYAVFWGMTPASPTVAQAYFSKIVAGQYMSTGGNGCLFSVP